MNRVVPRAFAITLGSVVLAFSLGLSVQAAVGDLGGYTADGVNIRQYPNTSSTSHGLGYTSHEACVVFYEEGETVNGSPWWAWHGNLTTSVEGYSWSGYVFYWVPEETCSF